MATIWFSGYHTGNTVKQVTAPTLGELIAQESLDVGGATIMLSRGGREQVVTDFNTPLSMGDMVSIQKSTVKSGICVASASSFKQRGEGQVPYLAGDERGNIILVNRVIDNFIVSGTVVCGETLELGRQSLFMRTRFTPFIGEVLLTEEL